MEYVLPMGSAHVILASRQEIMGRHVPSVHQGFSRLQPVIAKVRLNIKKGIYIVSTHSFFAVCQIGCTTCADGSGACQTCKPGFSRDANDATKCNPPAQATNSGVVCPSGSFSNGTSSCAPCASACQTCTGPASTDCIVCASGLFTLNGACVSANADGICQGSNLIADNNKRECDSKFVY